MRNALAALALISTLLFAQSAAGLTNGLDEQFGSGGVVLLGPTPVSGLKIDRISGLSIEDAGKIVIVGRFYVESGPDAGSFLAAIGRLNADGSWDTSFGDHGLFVLPYGAASAPIGGEFSELAVLSDHSVIAAGGAYNPSGTLEFEACILLAKVDDTGALSTTFAPDQSGSFCYGPSGYRSGHFEGLVADASDVFYVTSPSTGAVAHFDSNGALITSYGNNGVADLPVGIYPTLLQLVSTDLLAIGVSSGNSAIDVVRLDATGGIVTAYGSNGVFTFDQQPYSCCAVPIQATLDAQQRLLIADNDFGGAFYPYRFARVTNAGAFDVSFNASGQQPGYPGFATPVVSNTAYDNLVGVQPLTDGHLIAAGSAGYVTAGDGISNLALLRLNDDSSYDTAFGDTVHTGWSSINILGTATSSTGGRALAVDTSNHVFVAIGTGDGSQGCAGVVRLIPDRVFNGQFDAPAAFPTCP